MLRDLIAEVVESEPDLQIVDGNATVVLQDAISEAKADVVIANENEIDEDRALELVSRSAVRLIVVGEDGGRASVYECRPERETVGALSPELLSRLLTDRRG
jgi:hypothetical protein